MNRYLVVVLIIIVDALVALAIIFGNIFIVHFPNEAVEGIITVFMSGSFVVIHDVLSDKKDEESKKESK
jgi:hypothetical protein